MKKIIFILFVAFTTSLAAQKNYYTKKGAVAKGYDVVAYFANEAKQGSKKISTEYDGVKFYFSSQENLKAFKENPTKYVPQYGGFAPMQWGQKEIKSRSIQKLLKSEMENYTFFIIHGEQTH